MPSRGLRRAVSVLLAGVFVLSLGGEAYGWHDCPHHHPDPGTGDVPAEATAAAAEAGSAPLEPTGGPCTCVGSCHAAAASPLPGSAAAPAQVASAVRSVELGAIARPPRPRFPPYFLPYPNGPPCV